MSSARRPHLDQRRRMVIYSQRREDGEATRETTRQHRTSEDLYSRRNTASYGSRVHRRLRARWYGLVPVKRRTLIAFVASLCGLVAILAWGHWAALWWEPIAMRPDVARPLQLDRPDSFGAWFGAVFLAMTSGAALLVYQLRRYRSDDYHGHYRLWRIVIVVAMLASIDSVTQLTDWLGATLDAVFGQREIMAGSDWVRILWMIGGAAFALRLTGEVWKDRAALILTGITWSLFAVPAATHWNLIQWEMETGIFWLPVLSLAARTFMFVTVVTYLRTLYREVRGLAEKDRFHDRVRAVMPESWGRRLRLDQPDSSKPAEEPATRKRKSRKVEASPEEVPTVASEGTQPSSRWWSRWRRGAKGTAQDAGQSAPDEAQGGAPEEDERRESTGAKMQSRQTVVASAVTPRGSRSQAVPANGEDETEYDDKLEANAQRRGWGLRMPSWRRTVKDSDTTEDPTVLQEKHSKNSNGKGPSGDSEDGSGERRRRWWSLNRTAKDAAGSESEGDSKGRLETRRAAGEADEENKSSGRRRWWPLGRSNKTSDGDGDMAIQGQDIRADQEDVTKSRWWSRKSKPKSNGDNEEAVSGQTHDPIEQAEPKKRSWWPAFKARVETTDATEATTNEDDGAKEPNSRKLQARADRSTDEAESRGNQARTTQNASNKGPLPVRDVARKTVEPELDSDSYDENDDDDDQSDPQYANMSKAERRRLRKLQKRQGKAA